MTARAAGAKHTPGEDTSITVRSGSPEQARAHADRAVACVNACAGLKDPEKDIPAMLAALRDTVSVFSNRLQDLLDGVLTADCQRQLDCVKRARAILSRIDGAEEKG